LEKKELNYAQFVQLAEQICPKNASNDELFDEISEGIPDEKTFQLNQWKESGMPSSEWRERMKHKKIYT
jgi:hypothetical protein